MMRHWIGFCENILKKKLIFFLSVTEKALPLQSQLGIVLWCNGSTSDSGSACEGSNPSRTTTKVTLEQGRFSFEN